MRPLTLHASALSDAEYDFYTASFRDLVDDGSASAQSDAYYEDTTIGVREARAWLRGRYPELNMGDLDLILKLFCPSLDKADVLNGGQFFAALRLLTHVLGGASVDRNLIFIQATPVSFSRPTSPAKGVPKPVRGPPPPRHPPTRRQTQLFTTEPPSSDAPTPDGGYPPPPTSAHKRAFSMSHTVPTGSSTNPFTARSKTEDPSSVRKTEQPPPAPSAFVSISGKTPPLPPRKPANLAPPPRHQSVSAGSAPDPPPRKPPPPPVPSTSSSSVKTNLVSPLIQASLQASKVAQVTRQAEDRLNKERVMHVLKTSSTSPTPDSLPERTGRSLSPSKSTPVFQRTRTSPVPPPRPPLPSRKTSSPSPYTPSSASSESDRRKTSVFPAPEPPSISSNNPFRARLSRTSTHSLSPTRRDPPPPTHPDRKPQVSPAVPSPEASLSARLGRSKSLRSQSPSMPPTPPPRRKRPESVQITPTSSVGSPSPFGTPPHSAVPDLGSFRSPGSSGHGKTLSRHLSLSVPRREEISPTRGGSGVDTDKSPLANLQRRFEGLGIKAENALFKAEAGLSPRRGYLPHAHRGRARADETSLVRERSMENIEVDDDADSWSDRDRARTGPLSPGIESGWSRI